MGNTPKFRFQSGKLFFLVWYICTQATYTRTILTVLVKKCTIDVDLYVKFTLESFFLIFKNRTSYIHIFSVRWNNILMLYMYLNCRLYSTSTCNLNWNWSVRSRDQFFSQRVISYTSRVNPYRSKLSALLKKIDLEI